MQPLIKIAVVIVNYKTPRLVEDCLTSLKSTAERLNLSVFIGDAKSEDGSVEIIRDFIRREDISWAHCFALHSVGKFVGSLCGKTDKMVFWVELIIL